MKTIISHVDEKGSLDQATHEAKERIVAKGDLPHGTVQEQLEMLDRVLTTDLGRFMVQNGGLDGFWTEYICSYPERKARGQTAGCSPIEVELLERIPAFVTTQDRYTIFKREIRARVRDGGVYASVPCGLLGDLLSARDVAPGARFIGIDLDGDILRQARAAALLLGEIHRTEFWQMDAWDLDVREHFDLVSSTGLTMYVAEDERVERLYSLLYAALKRGGVLVTSVATPPPQLDPDSKWRLDVIPPEDLRRQMILLGFMQARFLNFRTAQATVKQLEKAGFVRVQVLFDKLGMFPTIIGEKAA